MPHGLLILTIETVPHKAGGVLAKLKELGRMDAIKVAESVDWDALVKWNDEQEAEVGIKGKLVETFGYELKGN
jgi:hypothetical protein